MATKKPAPSKKTINAPKQKPRRLKTSEMKKTTGGNYPTNNHSLEYDGYGDFPRYPKKP